MISTFFLFKIRKMIRKRWRSMAGI
jgi:hypothetical protein